MKDFLVVTSSAAIGDAIGALNGLLEQVSQMRGMFKDEDGTIAAAVADAEGAVKMLEAERALCRGRQ